MSSITYQKLDQRLANFEKTLNKVGYVPVLSSITSPVRALYGTAETIVGTTLHIFKSAQYVITANPEHRNEAAAGFWYSVHGAYNIERGSVEFIPIFGNISTLVYDHVFGLRMNYTFEYISPGMLPILESKKSYPAYPQTAYPQTV